VPDLYNYPSRAALVSCITSPQGDEGDAKTSERGRSPSRSARGPGTHPLRGLVRGGGMGVGGQ